MSGELCLKNRQRTRPLNLPLLRRIAVHLLHDHFRPERYEFCVHLVEADEMAEVNQNFLQHTGSTDVITFDYSDASGPSPRPAKKQSLAHPLKFLHGEVFISVPDAVAQAREFGTSWHSELTRYLIHGLLHLQGYDDLKPALRREMKREEQRLLNLTARKFKLSELQKSKKKPVKWKNALKASS